eukprot:TRINITY_DN1015_c1_g3_i5.p3 TRINITY_DN1015_c1_g3~~TRINITY_DN1015_c1_g3_i5.p3  ORF type:complete len:144 (-),score=32.68 TRINITY_DN1015_c1_g3_i5:665-1096(-)
MLVLVAQAARDEHSYKKFDDKDQLVEEAFIKADVDKKNKFASFIGAAFAKGGDSGQASVSGSATVSHDERVGHVKELQKIQYEKIPDKKYHDYYPEYMKKYDDYYDRKSTPDYPYYPQPYYPNKDNYPKKDSPYYYPEKKIRR